MSALHAGGAALGECLDFFQAGHADIARKCRYQSPVRPAQAQGLLGAASRQQAVEQSRRETIAAADAIKDVEMASGAYEALAVNPQNGRPVVPVCRMNFAQRGRHQLDVWMPLDDAIDHQEKRVWIEVGPGRDIRTGD